MKRRQFLKRVAFSGAAGLILPEIRLFGADAPSNKLNIALIGTWGRGEAHFGGMSTENVVALCDINEDHLNFGARKFPNAQKYVDWRKCLEQKDIDAVICCTADHTHAFVANWSMNRGKHIYCEKPLGNCVERSARGAGELPQEQEQAGHAGRHATPPVRELQPRAGADPRWGDRETGGSERLGQSQDSQAGLPARERHSRRKASTGTCGWDLLPSTPTTRSTSPAAPGQTASNGTCTWDFGSGQIGDMGSHTMDLAWNPLDADLPTTAEAKGDPFNPEVTPVKLEMHFDIPANDWRSGDKGFLVPGRRHA